MSNSWPGLTAGGFKRAAADLHQDQFDRTQATARAANGRPDPDALPPDPYAPPPEAHRLGPSDESGDDPPSTKINGDGLTAHFDGLWRPGPCRCNWRRDGRIGIAKRSDGSLVEGDVCPDCNLALYA